MTIPVKVNGPVQVDSVQTKRVTDLLSAILASVTRGTKEHPVHVVFDQSALVEAIGEVAAALRDLTKLPVSDFRFEGSGFVRVFAGDRPSEDIPFKKGVVVDSEGTPVDPQPELSYTFSSTSPSVVAIADNGNGTVHVDYVTPHQLEDGSFEIAELRGESNTIDLPDGSKLKDVFTEQIQLLPGIAAGFANSGFQFPPDSTPQEITKSGILVE